MLAFGDVRAVEMMDFDSDPIDIAGGMSHRDTGRETARFLMGRGSRRFGYVGRNRDTDDRARLRHRGLTEALQHELRNTSGGAVEAPLFVPGFVFTPLTAHGRTDKPDGGWTPEQTTNFLFDALERDDFYILCPDSEVDRATDENRIAWAAGDITENRPALSRWHPGWGAAFKGWLDT